MLYSYPNNLKQKATLWLWKLNDLIIIGAGGIVSVLLLTSFGFFPPLVITAAYAFLSIRFEDAAIIDFIRQAAAFFFFQQYFEWEANHETIKTRGKKAGKKNSKTKAKHKKANRPKRNNGMHGKNVL